MTKTMTVVGVLLLLACNKHNEAPAAHPPALPAEGTVGPDGRITVLVDGEGYHPATIHSTPGRAVTLVFRRTTDETCGQQLLVPSQNIRRDLPLNQPVEVALNLPASGNVSFTCGMHMYQGNVVTQ